MRGKSGRDGSQSALWDCFERRICRHVQNVSPKTVPQCTLTTILTRSPAQPQSGDYSHSPCSAIDRHVTAKCGLSQNFANTPWAACLKPVNGKCPNNFKTLDDPDGNSMYKACGSSMVCCLLTPVVNLQVITCKSLRH